MSKIIRVVSGRSVGATEVKNVVAGVPTITNEIITSLGLDILEARMTEMEQTFFKQDSAPIIGVNEGDVWYDFANDTLKVYREYPSNTGVYRWEPVIYKNEDTIDGGTW